MPREASASCSLEQGLADCRSQAGSSPLPIFVNKVFLLHMTKHHLLKRTSCPTALQSYLSSLVYSLITTTLFFFNWNTVDVQCCISSRCTAK